MYLFRVNIHFKVGNNSWTNHRCWSNTISVCALVFHHYNNVSSDYDFALFLLFLFAQTLISEEIHELCGITKVIKIICEHINYVEQFLRTIPNLCLFYFTHFTYRGLNWENLCTFRTWILNELKINIRKRTGKESYLWVMWRVAGIFYYHNKLTRFF